MRKSGLGFEVPSLKHSTTGFVRDCESLRFHGSGLVCCKCGCVKPLVNGLVADAGQFFEVVQPSTAVLCMYRIMCVVAMRAVTTSVTVVRRRKVQGFLGGNPEARSTKFVVFSFHDLLHCFAACMYIPFCSLGNMIVRMQGLPIGGLLSRIAASAVLAWEEHSWVEGWPCNFGLDASTPAWESAVFARRYIDDLVVVSKLLCFDCLVGMTQAMYTVTFDPAEKSRQLRWLDVVFDLDSLCLNIKRSMFPFPPPWDTCQYKLRAFLWGRLARYRQIGLDMSKKQNDLGLFLVSLRQQKFSRRRLRQAVFSMWNDSFADELRFLRAFVCVPQVIRIEVDRCDNSSKDEGRKEESRRKHRERSHGRKRDFSSSSSSSFSSHSRRKSSKRKGKKSRRAKSSREGRLERELEMLQAEKAARETAAQQDKLKHELDSQVEAVKKDLMEKLAKLQGTKPEAAAKLSPNHPSSLPGQSPESNQELTPAE
eukprot:s117_g3.t1